MEKQFADYINLVCQEVTDPKDREKITLELTDHLISIYEDNCSEGLSHEEAVAKALSTMEDDPRKLGRQLQEAYSGVQAEE